MRCLNRDCRQDGLSRSTQICPACGASQPSLMIGLLPFDSFLQSGKYAIDHPHGRGGFGVTYRARQQGLGRLVAIKEYFPLHQAYRDSGSGNMIPLDESFHRGLKRFANEGRLLAMLNHPNVVLVHDSFEEYGTAYLVMEMIVGQTLRDEMAAFPGKGLAEPRVRELMEQMVSALEAVHRKEIYHLDIKPENVMVRAGNDSAVLVDFGAARQIGFTSSASQPHTWEYAPLEIIVGASSDQIGAHSDVFELGMMLHELLTGELPPPALSRASKDNWQPVKLPEGWRQIVVEALILDWEQRPGTVREWWESMTRKKARPPAKPPLWREFEFKTLSLDETGAVITPLRKRAESFAEEIAAGITLEMVKVPAGEFRTGSPEPEMSLPWDFRRHEHPQRPVNVKGFCLAKHPITGGQWEAVAQLPIVNRDLPEFPSGFEDSSQPVVRITWFEAMEFCARLSKKTGREYRLPSEAEWEFACRAGTASPFAFGETITPEVANFQAERNDRQTTKGQPVSTGDLRVANGFGLFGMHGGVWEWCEDAWHDNYYGDAPNDGSAWLTGGDEAYRVVRGGGWDDPPDRCRAAFRKRLAPDIENDDVGLRVVCSLLEPG